MDLGAGAVELGLFPQAVRSIVATNAVFDALTVNPKRSLEELEDEDELELEPLLLLLLLLDPELLELLLLELELELLVL